MDDTANSITPEQLYARLGNAETPMIVDVRRAPAFEADSQMIAGAIRHTPDDVTGIVGKPHAAGIVVVYCAHGHEVSQGAMAALRSKGVDARYLAGGIGAWKQHELPTRRKGEPSEKIWVTREHPKIDRIACPWLVSRFVVPDARFLYVPPQEVEAVAAKEGGTPYDIKGVKYGHVGDECSFDAIVRHYDIHDAALDRLARIVRGADTSRPDLTPEGPGLLALSYGLSRNFPDDHVMLRHGLVMYDALYAWCRMQEHGSPAHG